MRNLLVSVGVILLVLSTSLTPSWAGTTGKIVGTVKDATTGESLPGANVTIVGTTMGAATNPNGYYVIINIPVGAYSVKATMMGYEGVTTTGVRSIQDLTTTVDFRLKPMVIQIGEGVTVVAERPLVIKDATSTTHLISVKEMVRALAAVAPVVIEVEDSHWLDASSAEWLTAMTRWARRHEVRSVKRRMRPRSPEAVRSGSPRRW